MKIRSITLLISFLFAATSLFAQKWNPRHPSWTDSYAANGFCWCRTSFDHDLDNINKVSFNINGKKRNIRDICDELKKHPSYRNYKNGDAPFNDIQCGHGPANTAPDEKGCPGRTDKGSGGCFERGPKWDTKWLASRPRFGGNPNPNPAPTPPPNPNPSNNKGPNVSFAKPSNANARNLKTGSNLDVDVTATDADGIANVRLYVNNKFVRQENVAPYLWGNKDNALKNLKVGIYELKAVAQDKKGNKSEAMIVIKVSNSGDSPSNPSPNPAPVVDNGNAPIGKTITLRKSGGNQNYLTAERDGNNQVIARATRIGGWEQFIVESHPKGGIALKAVSNKKYIQTNNTRTNSPVRGKGNAKGTWERFEWKSKGNGKVAIKSLHNGKWLQASWNDANAIVYPKGNNDGNFETFNWAIAPGKKAINDAVSGFAISQNPVNSGDDLYLEVTSKEVAKATVTLNDITGKFIVSINYTVIDGVNSIDLTAVKSTLTAKGVYILTYVTNSSKRTIKVLVD